MIKICIYSTRIYIIPRIRIRTAAGINVHINVYTDFSGYIYFSGNLDLATCPGVITRIRNIWNVRNLWKIIIIINILLDCS